MSAPAPKAVPTRLPLWGRARVLARRTLFVGLRAVPAPVVDTVHDRWIASSGRRRAPWRPLATALFYRPLDHEVITVPGGAGERLAVVGSRLERTLWWYGEQGYEPSEAYWWRRLCGRATRVLEVGANIGYYSVVGAAAAPAGAYTAVEAQPEAAALVRRNLALNDLPHARVVEGAVVGGTVDSPAEVELALPDQEAFSTAPTGSYLRVGTEGVATRTASRSMTVPAVAAGPLFAGCDLVKLDIEGSEAAVLDAALSEIRRARPILLVEVLAGSTRLLEVLRALDAEGYRLFALAARLRPMTLVELTRSGDRDVLLVPAERADEL